MPDPTPFERAAAVGLPAPGVARAVRARRVVAHPGHRVHARGVVPDLRDQHSPGPANLANIGMQSTILLMLALPMTLIILTEGIDLSMGAVLTVASVGAGPPPSSAPARPLSGWCAALALGRGVRLVNGALTAWVGIPPFVVTLGTMGIAQGLRAHRHRRAEHRRHAG